MGPGDPVHGARRGGVRRGGPARRRTGQDADRRGTGRPDPARDAEDRHRRRLGRLRRPLLRRTAQVRVARGQGQARAALRDPVGAEDAAAAPTRVRRDAPHRNLRCSKY